MRINYWQVFKIHHDGGIEPVRRVRIGGVEFGPGVRFGKGVAFSGIDLNQYIGHDFEVEEQGDVLIVKGIYGQR